VLSARAAFFLAGLSFTFWMIAKAEPFPKGRLTDLESPADIYRFARDPTLPAVILAYAGDAGRALRDALAVLAPTVPGGIVIAVRLEGLLQRVPSDAFGDTPIPELADGGMETLALAVNARGDRRRWTTSAGPETEALLADPAAQAQALIAWAKS
jgi:hypothetical protein